MLLRERVLVLIPLVVFALPLAAQQEAPREEAGEQDTANPDLQAIKTEAERLERQADACARMKCPQADCASLAGTLQALIDAETILEALDNALLEKSAVAREGFNNAASTASLTGTKLARMQRTVALQEALHRFGTYMLKIASIINTFKQLEKNTFNIDKKKLLLDTAERLDSLGTAIKNAFDVLNDYSDALEHLRDETPAASDTRKQFNWWMDIKSSLVDLAKTVRDAKIAYDKAKEAQARVVPAIEDYPNLLALIGRTAKLISEKELQLAKAALKDLESSEGPEAEAVTGALNQLQLARKRQYTAEGTLAAVRRAAGALEACTAKASCGAQTLSRPALPAYTQLGEALRDLDARLPELAKRLGTGIGVTNKCSDPGGTPQTKRDTSAASPPPRHAIENNCPSCADIALDLARTLDGVEFDSQELHRIRLNIEKAEDLEKDAQLLRDAIERINVLIDEFRNGKAGSSTTRRINDALFRQTGNTEIDIQTLEQEKRERQNKIHDIDERIAALRAEEGTLGSLGKDHLRLYELSEKLKIRLAECRKRCPMGPEERLYERTKAMLQLFEKDLLEKRRLISGKLVGREASELGDEKPWTVTESKVSSRFQEALEGVRGQLEDLEATHKQVSSGVNVPCTGCANHYSGNAANGAAVYWSADPSWLTLAALVLGQRRDSSQRHLEDERNRTDANNLAAFERKEEAERKATFNAIAKEYRDYVRLLSDDRRKAVGELWRLYDLISQLSAKKDDEYAEAANRLEHDVFPGWDNEDHTLSLGYGAEVVVPYEAYDWCTKRPYPDIQDSSCHVLRATLMTQPSVKSLRPPKEASAK